MKGLLLASMLVASGATLAVAQLAPPARTQDQASDQTSHSSQRMAAYLARVAQNADPVINVYLNRARAAGMRTLLSGPLAPAKEIQLRATIARELINGGLMQEAIEEIDTIRRRMAEEDVTSTKASRACCAISRPWPISGWVSRPWAVGQPMDGC